MVILLVIGSVLSNLLFYYLGTKSKKKEVLEEEKIELTLEEKLKLSENYRELNPPKPDSYRIFNLKNNEVIQVYDTSTTGVTFKYSGESIYLPKKVFTWEKIIELTDDFYPFYPESLKNKLDKDKDSENIKKIVRKSKQELDDLLKN